MRRGFLVEAALLILGITLVGSPVLASGPSSNPVLDYQIRLMNSSGVPVADGQQNIIISIYDSAVSGTRLYTDCGTTGTPAARKVIFSNGVGTVLIGDASADGTHNCVSGAAPTAIPQSLFTNTTLYLGITIGSDAEMTPRKRIVSTGYALDSSLLNDLNSSSVGGTNAFIPATDANGLFTLTGTPSVSTAVITANPASPVSGALLLNLENNGTSVFSVNAQGNTVIAGSSGNLTVGGNLTVSGSGTNSITGNVLPGADNTYDLGSTSLRWHTLNVGPGSVVVHNDNTNTQRMTLDFSGANAARVSTDSTTTLQLTTDSNNGIFIGTSGLVGINNVSPSTGLDVTGLTISTNANNTVAAERATATFTKNTGTTATYPVVSIAPTFNFGGSNASTTVNVLDIDSTNTNVTGLTANLIRAAYGGTQEFLVDSSGNVTGTGNLAVNGGSLTTTAGTANIFNANATTIGIGGAATSVTIGANSAGTTTVQTDLTVSRRINAAAHANNQGLRLPTNAGTPSAVTGQQAGDVVWDNSNHILYVYNGSSFFNVTAGASAVTMQQTYNNGPSGSNIAITTQSTDGDIVFNGTQHFQVSMTSATGNTFSVSNSSLTTGQLTNFASTNNTAAATTWSADKFAITNSQGTTANSPIGLDVQWNQNPSVAGNTEYAMRIQNEITANVTDTTVSGLLLIDNADTSTSGSTVVTDGIRITNSGGISGGITNGVNVATATITNGFVVSAGVTNAFDVTSTAVTTDFRLQNGATIDNHTNGVLNLSAQTTQITSTATSQNVFSFTASGLTSGSLISATASALTTGTVLNLTSTNNSASAANWSANKFTITNAQGTTSNTDVGLDIQWNQNPSAAGDTEYAMRIQNQVSSNTTDTTISGLLFLDNADNSGTGSTIVTDGVRVTNSGGISGGITNGVNVASATITNGFVVSAGVTTAFNVTSTAVTTDFRLQNGATIDNHTNGMLNLTATTTQITSTATSQNILTFSAPSLSTGSLISWTSPTMTTGSILNFTANNNSASLGTWSPYIFRANNVQSTTAVTSPNSIIGMDVQWFQNPTGGDSTQYGERIVNLVTTNTTDTTIDALLLVDNADTSATGSTIVTDGIRITNSGAISGGITNGVNVNSATITNGFVVSAGVTTAFDVTSTAVTTDLRLQNGATIDNHTSGTLNLTANTTQITSTTSSATVLSFSDTSLTTGNLISWTSPTMGGGAILNFTANNDNHTGQPTWSPYIFRANNVQSTTAITSPNSAIGMDVQFFQNPSVAGDGTEYAMRVVNLVTSNTNDTTVDSLLLVDNADTNAVGSTIVTDGIRITNSGAISGGITNGVNINSATITNGFVVSAGVTNAFDVTSTSVTTDFRMQNGATMDNHTNGVVAITATTLHVVGQVELNLPGTGTGNALCHTTQSGTTNEFIVDCTSAPAADYAEQYPMAQGIDYGDIVMASDTMVNATNGSQVPQLVKTAQPYQSKVLGVVVNNYGDFTSSGYNINAQDNPMPLALSGRVPVKVTTENGDIAIGDPITASSLAGVGMKATQPGMIIGFALNAYSSADKTAVGQILVFVNTSWWNGAQGNASTPSSLSNLSQLTVTSDLNMNGQGIYDISSLRGANGLWSIGADGTLTTKLVKADKVVAKKYVVANAADDMKASSGTIQGGQLGTLVVNPNVTSQSLIVLTFEGNPGSAWWISEKADGKFMVNLASPAPADLSFTYWIVGVEGGMTGAADSTASAPPAASGSTSTVTTSPAPTSTDNGSTTTTTPSAPTTASTSTGTSTTTTGSAPSSSTTSSTSGGTTSSTTTSAPSTTDSGASSTTTSASTGTSSTSSAPSTSSTSSTTTGSAPTASSSPATPPAPSGATSTPAPTTTDSGTASSTASSAPTTTTSTAPSTGSTTTTPTSTTTSGVTPPVSASTASPPGN